jgi:hypothetical protein
MSWNLLIYRPGSNDETAPLGSLTTVRRVMDSAFRGLTWPSEAECELDVEGGFSVEWNIDGDQVSDGYTNGGFQHLSQLAGICKKMGWRLADAQEGEDINLDDPMASYEGRDDE